MVFVENVCDFMMVDFYGGAAVLLNGSHGVIKMPATEHDYRPP